MLTQKDVRDWFTYPAAEGGLIRRDTAPWKLRWVSMASGYIHTNIRGETWYQHRLVFLFHHGYLPPVVDHIDGNKSNNRIENLRAATHTQNKHNVLRRSHNTTGAKGVVFHKNCPGKPYQAKIVREGRTYSFGYHSSLEEAAAAYEAGAKQVAGEFARADFTKQKD